MARARAGRPCRRRVEKRRFKPWSREPGGGVAYWALDGLELHWNGVGAMRMII